MDNNELGTDCISRKQAIDAIEHITTSMSICVNSDECHGMKRMQRQAVIELANMPTIQPEIVRCKDCKHWIPYDWMFSEVWQSKNMADYPEDEMGCNWCDMAMKADDFCSRAERREVTT